MTIHRKLRWSNAIRSVLSDAVLADIAQILGELEVSGDVESAVAAIEASIETATVVQLNAWSLLMVEDVAVGKEPQRSCGFAAQVGLGYELLDPYGGTPGFIVALSSDMPHAPDPSGQMTGHISFSGLFNLASENTTTGSFSYEIVMSASSTLKAMYSSQRLQAPGVPTSTTHRVTCGMLLKVPAVNV